MTQHDDPQRPAPDAHLHRVRTTHDDALRVAKNLRSALQLEAARCREAAGAAGREQAVVLFDLRAEYQTLGEIADDVVGRLERIKLPPAAGT